MDVQEKLLRAVGPQPPAPLAPPAVAAPRRTLHRVETAAQDLSVELHLGDEIMHGHLLNISAGGCSVRIGLPLTLTLDAGITIGVGLALKGERLLCPGELVGLDLGKGSVSLRLRFRALAPEARRALLSWIGALVTRDFQLRHTGGNHAWSDVGGDSDR